MTFHEMIKNVAASFEGRCTQKKISIELVFARKHLKVVADKRKIQQVLYNLLDNATNSVTRIQSLRLKRPNVGIRSTRRSKIMELEFREMH